MGIDPGKSGSIAVIDDSTSTRCSPLLCMRLNEPTREIADFLDIAIGPDPAQCYIEKVHAMPKQGVTSSFTFGESYGMIQGLLAANRRIRYERVTPQKWQQAMQCLTKGDKNVSKARAMELFPDGYWDLQGNPHKIIHAVADAILIAEYCRRHPISSVRYC